MPNIARNSPRTSKNSVTGTQQAHNVSNLTATFSPIPPPISISISYLLQPKQKISCYINLESNTTTQLITSLSRDTKSQIYSRIAHFIHNCFDTHQNFIKELNLNISPITKTKPTADPSTNNNISGSTADRDPDID